MGSKGEYTVAGDSWVSRSFSGRNPGKRPARRAAYFSISTTIALSSTSSLFVAASLVFAKSSIA